MSTNRAAWIPADPNAAPEPPERVYTARSAARALQAVLEDFPDLTPAQTVTLTNARELVRRLGA